MIALEFYSPRELRLEFLIPEESGQNIKGRIVTVPEDKPPEELCEIDSIAFRRIIEVKIPFKILAFNPGDKMSFRIRLLKENHEIESCPLNNLINLDVPDENFEKTMWKV